MYTTEKESQLDRGSSTQVGAAREDHQALTSRNLSAPTFGGLSAVRPLLVREKVSPCETVNTRPPRLETTVLLVCATLKIINPKGKWSLSQGLEEGKEEV